jgi:hypothetical protein
MALKSTQPLTEMSTRIFVRVNDGRRVRLTFSPPFVRRWFTKCGSLDFSQIYESPWPITEIAFTCFDPTVGSSSCVVVLKHQLINFLAMLNANQTSGLMLWRPVFLISSGTSDTLTEVFQNFLNHYKKNLGYYPK